MYLAMRESHPPEEIYHQVSIVADDRTVEEGGPLEAAGTSCSKQPEEEKKSRSAGTSAGPTVKTPRDGETIDSCLTSDC